MQWIDKDFYAGTYSGTSIPDAQFDTFANAAERLIDQLTHFRLSQSDFSTLPDIIQQQVKMAACAQTEYFYESGGHSEASMASVASASLGSFHFDMGNGQQSGSNLVSDAAIAYLTPTGLLYSGVSLRGC